MNFSFKDEQAKKKFFLIGGCILAAILIIVIAAAILASSLSGGKKYSEYYEDAQLAYLTRDYTTALEDAKKALDAKETEEIYILLADIYVAQGDDESAVNILYTGYSKVGGDKISAYLEELKGTSEEEEISDSTITVAGKPVSADTTSFVSPDAGLTDDAVAGISQLTNLKNVNLSGNLLTSSCLTEISKCSSLEYLDLSSNNITDISTLRNCRNLKYLYLDNNAIEDFTPLYDVTSLETISIKGIEMTQSQYDELCEALPGCSVFTGDLTEEVVEINLGGKTFMSDVTELDLRGLGITDISELSKCTSLEKLDLRDNAVEDISPLMDLKNLKWLCLWNNKVSDLGPLMNMPLEYLDLDGNEVTDITAISYISTLQELWLSNNTNIHSFSSLKNLTGLMRLGLKNVGLTDDDLDTIEEITSLIELNLESNDDITLNRVEELKEALPKCTVAISDDITFETEIGGQKYSSNATTIIVDSSSVSDISDLSHFTKLETLSLNYNSVQDLSPLSGLTTLTSLDLAYNGISDISSLKDLRALRSLNLIGNSINSVSALSGLTSLTELHLSYNSITDISGLTSLTSMRDLDLDGNAITDISVLRNMTNLTTLSLESTSVKDLSPLYGLANLRTLHIRSISGITAEDVNALRTALPNCTIIADYAPGAVTPAPEPVPVQTDAPVEAAP